MPKLKTALGVIAGVALLCAVVVAVWQWKAAMAGEAALGRLAAENRALKTKLDEVTRERDALREAQGALPLSRPAGAERNLPDKEALAKAAADALTIRQLREELAAAHSNVSNLEERVAQLEGELKDLTQENQRRAQSQQELGEKIAGLNRIISAMERETRSRDERLAQLELANKRLREENAIATRKTAEAARMAADLQDLYRRRETYLSSILNRYREVTEQFRAFAGMLENRGRQEGTSGGSAELARIQNSIQMTEEDLRQLSSLNAQAIQLQRKIFGK
jgi:chromosome segregation ATPase